MVLDVSRLPSERQLSVSNALKEAITKPRTPPLQDTTLSRAQAVLATTSELRVHVSAPPGQVDRATGTVVSAFGRAVAEQERALLDSVVPLDEEQQMAASRLQLIRTRVFRRGTQFIRRTMDLEWPALCEVREAVEDPTVMDAIEGQGLRPVVDHLLRHIALYAQALGHEAGAAGSAVEKASHAWHEAFKRLAAQVLLDYEHDEATRRELLGPYEAQLDEQRAVERAARAKRNASQPQPAPPKPAPDKGSGGKVASGAPQGVTPSVSPAMGAAPAGTHASTPMAKPPPAASPVKPSPASL